MEPVGQSVPALEPRLRPAWANAETRSR
jgi:hypothetical protein